MNKLSYKINYIFFIIMSLFVMLFQICLYLIMNGFYWHENIISIVIVAVTTLLFLLLFINKNEIIRDKTNQFLLFIFNIIAIVNCILYILAIYYKFGVLTYSIPSLAIIISYFLIVIYNLINIKSLKNLFYNYNKKKYINFVTVVIIFIVICLVSYIYLRQFYLF